MAGRSAKIKGNAYERKVAHILSKAFNTRVQRIPMSGALDGWKGDLRDLSGVLKRFVWECKHQEKLNIWAALRQAEGETSGGRIPVVVFHKNHSKDYVALDLQDFIMILQEKNNESMGN